MPPPVDPSYWWEPYAYGDYIAEVALLISVLTFIAAIIVAIRQFKIMADQTEMMGRQTELGLEQKEIAKRQEALTEEQGRIAQKQYEIAERQRQILEESLAKRTMLRVNPGNQRRLPETTGWGWAILDVEVINLGTKTADGFHWELFIPRDVMGTVTFVDRDGNELKSEGAPFPNGQLYDKLEGHYVHKLFPMSDVLIANVSAHPEHPRTAKFVLKWRIRGEDGVVPGGEKLAEIHYERNDDGMFSMTLVDNTPNVP